jgi:type II secretion system protein J
MRPALCRKFVSEIYASHIFKAGFTLLEVVIAITILALAFTGLYSTFSSTLDTTEAVETERDVEQAARLGLMRIADDLASIYYQEVEGDYEDSPYSLKGGETEASDQGGTVLELSTSSSLDFNMIFPSLQINRVSYALEKQSDSESHFQLIRRELPFTDLGGEGQERTIEVVEDVEELTLSFLDGEGQMQSQWDSEASEGETRLPRLVQIRLKLAGDQSRFFSTSVALPPLSTTK